MNTVQLRKLALAAKGHTRGSYVLASFAAKANPTAILELLDALKEVDGLVDAKNMIAYIKADNDISYCEGDWCGKTVIKGIQQKCHRCTVQEILKQYSNRSMRVPSHE